MPIVLPPVEEQKRIVESIARETSELQDSIGRLSREIDLLAEYRTRLIADLVTGKLDVRAAAAQVPEDFGRCPGTDEDDALEQFDEEAAEA